MFITVKCNVPSMTAHKNNDRWIVDFVVLNRSTPNIPWFESSSVGSGGDERSAVLGLESVASQTQSP